MGKSMLVGAALAIALIVVVGVGGYLYSQRAGVGSDSALRDHVVLIFEAPAEDGATVAALIAVVADGEIQDVDPETTVTIPGTSYNRLGDAFVFGGGDSVARALGDRDGGPTAYVSVPKASWRGAVDAAGGIQVSVPREMTVFDGVSLATIRAGNQRLTAAQVEAALRGLSFLEPQDQAVLRRQLGLQLASALIVSGARADNLDSSLSQEALAAWMDEVLANTAKPQMN